MRDKDRIKLKATFAVSVVMFALASCTSYTPMVQSRYDIPCRYTDSLPDIGRDAVWTCNRFIDSCSCVATLR